MSAAFERLAELAGIQSSFADYFGKVTGVDDDTKRSLLVAMGFDVSSNASVAAAVDELEAQERNPPCVFLDQSQTDLPLGYHRDGQRTVIVAPSHCYLPTEMRDGRIWALATQLYGLRSERNWGVGDFTDLASLARLAGDAGARAIALNPLHELHPNEPLACSPYSPSSRSWLNSLYVDVAAVADFAESGQAGDYAPLRDGAMVDYGGAARAKRMAFEICFTSFRRRHLERPGDARAAAFRAFVRGGGEPLERLALYEALTEHFRALDANSFGWLQWPGSYQDPTSSGARAFVRARRDRVDFYLYLQWIADEQLRAAAASAASSGVGFYRDLAVGVDRNSADVWGDRETILESVSLGAPPDALNALGQNWGLPPLSPHALRAQGYAPLARLLRANMRHATILRIDHVMALRRAFWIPLGRAPRDGAYVNYRFDEMLAVVALESTLNRCTVVGEDLGTVPDGFRERMQETGILSSRLVYFERDYHTGRFAPPSSYPELAAASIGTHDLPPLAGWWTGDDLALRARIGLFPDETSARNATDERRHARFMLVEALEQNGCADAETARRLRADAETGPTLAVYDLLMPAVYRFLSKTPSRLAVVAIEDVMGQVDAINVPGTTDQHPNWRRKHIATLEELERTNLLKKIGSLFNNPSAQRFNDPGAPGFNDPGM
ncbi:MAG TPA: 4-alpha-glucanotransferase [Candidatus Baltobacteraceae bacterium]